MNAPGELKPFTSRTNGPTAFLFGGKISRSSRPTMARAISGGSISPIGASRTSSPSLRTITRSQIAFTSASLCET